MTASLETVHELADKVGLDLRECSTRSEMKRVTFAHYDRKHRKAYNEGQLNMSWVTPDDTALLDALEINSFRKL